MDDDQIIAAALAIIQRRSTGAPRLLVSQLYEPFARAKAALKSWITVERALRPAIEYFGDRDVMSLTVADTEDYRALRRTKECRHGKGRKLGHKSINFELAWFKTMLAWAVRGGRISHNPIAAMTAAKVQRHRNTSPTEEEIGQLLAHADLTLSGFILFAADAGMRRDEIRLCRWGWVDLDARLITLPAASTKSQRERRVPIADRMLAWLRLTPRHVRSPFVFANPDNSGEPFAAVTINGWFRRVADRSGVKAAPGDGRVHLHDLRHAYARRSARAGVRIDVISMILGHANLQQTKDYLQTGDDDIADARETFDAALRKGPARADDTSEQPHVAPGRLASPGEKTRG